MITSEPDGADVYINDQLRGQTPFQMEFEVGEYSYRLDKILYHPEAGKLNLSTENKEIRNIKLRSNFGYIRVSTLPENGATVTVNGSPLPSNSPVTSGMLKSGVYNVEASKALFHSVSQQVTVTDGQTSSITLNMQPAFGGVTIRTSPEQGAEVLLNGNPTGKTTPTSLERLPRGEHTITVRKEWYQPQTQRVTLTDGESKVLSIAMQPTFGNVKITAEADASIYIANEFKAKGKWEGRLIAGLYTVEARRERYHNDTKQMQVELGKTHNLSLHPKPMQGALEVVTTPFEAKIIINGIDYGTTPNTIRELLVGEYTLEIVKDGHATVTKTVTITEGKTTVVNENLSSGMEVTIASNPSGAQLTIDGVSVGSTPFTTMLGFGIHKLKLVNGKKILNEEVFVKQDGKNKWEFDVQSGKDIAIGSDPVGLEVIIDGLSYGKAPVRTNISYGKHNIKIVNGNRVVEETIDVTRDDKNIWIFNNEDFDEPEMVLVNGGRFTMGCTREQGSSCDWPERPTRVVSVNDFYISKYEVTQSLWKAIMGKRPSVFSICDNCPVENISWNDAQIFIKKLNEITKKNYRLPTEAEWEFAARGGTSSKGFIYSGGNKIEAVAWYLNNSTSKTHPVGLKKPNELGIYDMTGNVYEWCSDWFGNYPDYSQTNPKGPSNGKSKVFRGGGFAKEKGSCRVSFRGYNAPDYKDGGIGLRLVLSSY